LIDVETHREVFTGVLRVLAEQGLLKGQRLGIDATTLEAKAALRTIVRRDTGEGYPEFQKRLAQASGIATATREQLARLDRKRAHKGSNQEWEHPPDSDARIAPMKGVKRHFVCKPMPTERGDESSNDTPWSGPRKPGSGRWRFLPPSLPSPGSFV
jgi:hypothetical protein